MASRREFLQGTIALTALPLMSGTALGFASGTSTTALYKAVYDERFPQARAFAEQMQRQGTPIEGFKGDITAIWFNDLHKRWTVGPVAVAGMTEAPALFLLERLAWDHQMRVRLLVEHLVGADGSVQHNAQASAASLAADLTAAGSHWTSYMASAIGQVPKAAPMLSGPSLVGVAANSSDRSAQLYSWIIAPTSTRA